MGIEDVGSTVGTGNVGTAVGLGYVGITMVIGDVGTTVGTTVDTRDVGVGYTGTIIGMGDMGTTMGMPWEWGVWGGFGHCHGSPTKELGGSAQMQGGAEPRGGHWHCPSGVPWPW